MITDALVNFVAIGQNLSLVGGVGVAIPSSVIDLLGSGVGTAPQNIIGNATVFGTDQGVGGDKPKVEVVLGTACTAGAGIPTLNVQFQAAVDTGAAGGYQPGAWTTLMETGPIAIANLTAAQVLARFDFPPAFPANLNPRFLRLNFAVPAGTNFAAGTVNAAPVTMVRDDMAQKYAAANFRVA